MEIIKTTKYNVADVFKRPLSTFGSFRQTREDFGLSVQRKCFRCNRKFADEENIYIAVVKNVGNKLFCQQCASDYFKSQNNKSL